MVKRNECHGALVATEASTARHLHQRELGYPRRMGAVRETSVKGNSARQLFS